MDPTLAMINGGLVIKCNITENADLSDEEKEFVERGGTPLSTKATNITSLDLDYLQCREWRSDFDNTSREHDDDDLSAQTQTQTETRTKPLASSTKKGRNERREKTISL